MSLVKESLEGLGVKCKLSAKDADTENINVRRLRVGGYDRRKVMFKGWVEIERFGYSGKEGSFCIMQRDEVRAPRVVFVLADFFWLQGNPISWRQLWKALIKSDAVEPHVLRK
jgi:serine/threonine-protein kinase CHEK1